LPYFSYGLSGSIGIQIPVAPGFIWFHVITSMVLVARLNLCPVTGTAVTILTAVLPIATFIRFPVAFTITLVIPTPAKGVAANDVAPKNIIILYVFE